MKRTMEEIVKEFGPLIVKGVQVRASTMEELCAWMITAHEGFRVGMKHELVYVDDVAVDIEYKLYNTSGNIVDTGMLVRDSPKGRRLTA